MQTTFSDAQIAQLSVLIKELVKGTIFEMKNTKAFKIAFSAASTDGPDVYPSANVTASNSAASKSYINGEVVDGLVFNKAGGAAIEITPVGRSTWVTFANNSSYKVVEGSDIVGMATYADSPTTAQKFSQEPIYGSLKLYPYSGTVGITVSADSNAATGKTMSYTTTDTSDLTSGYNKSIVSCQKTLFDKGAITFSGVAKLEYTDQDGTVKALRSTATTPSAIPNIVIDASDNAFYMEFLPGSEIGGDWLTVAGGNIVKDAAVTLESLI